MPRKTILCLILAVSVLTGCASSKPQLIQPTIPSLDSALSAPCPPVSEPVDDSVDSLIDSYLDLVGKYSDCSRRHDATVEAWEKLK